MGTYPTSPRSAFLEWCAQHAGVFTDNATAIGLSAAQALAFKNAATVAVEADANQFAAKEAAKAATAAATMKTSDLRRIAGETVRVIKNFAETSNNPDVYILAQIPAPSAPSPLPPPGKPFDMIVGIEPGSGAITLRWKCDNPRGAAGTSYIVRRRTPDMADFEFVGVTGTKKFTDATFRAGPDAVMYTVQAQRSDSSGLASDILTINFGRSGGGPVPFSTVTGVDARSTTTQTRLAA